MEGIFKLSNMASSGLVTTIGLLDHVDLPHTITIVTRDANNDRRI
jgi:hypothetical protein